MYKAVQTSRLYEQIVDQIEDAILKRKLKPGDQLPPERQMAKQFGVSRIAVREAVKSLSERGLVEAVPGRGTFITSVTSHTIRNFIGLFSKYGQEEGQAHLVEAREILELEIAALAAARVKEEHVTAMKEACEAMERTRLDPERFLQAEYNFHLALAEAAANPVIESLLDSIVELLREQRQKIFQVAGGPERGQHHHKEILEAVERKDAEAARKAMREYLEKVRQVSTAEVQRREENSGARNQKPVDSSSSQ